MDSRSQVAAQSRDSHLALRRVERQQLLIERLYATSARLTLLDLARGLGVSERTVARDVQRLQESGVPLRVAAGRGGGVSLESRDPTMPVELDLPEIAALMSSLAVLGPSVSDSAASAMRKLARAVDRP